MDQKICLVEYSSQLTESSQNLLSDCVQVLNNLKYKKMHVKWKVYLVTLFSYGTIHSIRTMWSAIKSDLTVPPFNYEVSYLGSMDMVVLFVLAVSMNVMGPKIEKWGPKKVITIAMIALLVLSVLVGLFLALNFTNKAIYAVFFGVGVGVFSSLGWPSCLCMVSYYFNKQNGMALSAWNGSSQLGDLISLMTYYLLVITKEWPTQTSFFLIAFYLLLCMIAIRLVIPNTLKADLDNKQQQNNEEQAAKDVQIQLNEQKLPQLVKQSNPHAKGQIPQYQTLQQNSEKQEDQKVGQLQINKLNQPNQSEQNSLPAVPAQPSPKMVNVFTVWLLPGVAFNVLAYGLIKSVNAFIISWLVYYLLMIGMGSEAVLMTVIWSVSVFVGGTVCGLINKQFNKLVFIGELSISAICFILLEEFHLDIYQIQIIVLIVICALFYGGPYNLMSTAIPILLGNQEKVRSYENGKASIISLMQGFGQLACGFSLLLIPLFGVSYIHTVGAIYCGLASVLLLCQFLREKRFLKRKTQELKLNKRPKQKVSQQREERQVS